MPKDKTPKSDFSLLADAIMNPKPQPKLYYIQNKGFVGNCLLWWRPEGHGYTCDIDQAWKVTREKADEICSSRPKKDIPHLVQDVDACAVRHVTSLEKQEEE